MALRIVEKAALSDVGRQRQGNEDSFLERSPLFAVADGMGGARAGEVASRIAVEQFDVADDADTLARRSSSPRSPAAPTARSTRWPRRTRRYAGMGTTFTAALVTGREIAIGHVGDSRLYRFRDGELERLTHDHSLVEEFVRQGKLTPAEAEVHPQRSIITRALGPEPEVEVDTYTHSGRDGDVYLINSDGLTGMINEQKVARDPARPRRRSRTPPQKLIAAANENGGKDNITVVLFRLGSDGDGPSDEDGARHARRPGDAGGRERRRPCARRWPRAETTKARDVPTMTLAAAERPTQVRAKVIDRGQPEPPPAARLRPQRAPPPHRAAAAGAT